MTARASSPPSAPRPRELRQSQRGARRSSCAFPVDDRDTRRFDFSFLRGERRSASAGASAAGRLPLFPTFRVPGYSRTRSTYRRSCAVTTACRSRCGEEAGRTSDSPRARGRRTSSSLFAGGGRRGARVAIPAKKLVRGRRWFLDTLRRTWETDLEAGIGVIGSSTRPIRQLERPAHEHPQVRLHGRRSARRCSDYVLGVGMSIAPPRGSGRALADNPPTPTPTRIVLLCSWRSCGGCHRRGGPAPMSLLEYQEADALGRNAMRAPGAGGAHAAGVSSRR